MISLLAAADRPSHNVWGLVYVWLIDVVFGYLLIHVSWLSVFLLGLIQYAWVLPLMYSLKKRQMNSMLFGIKPGAGIVLGTNLMLFMLLLLLMFFMPHVGFVM